MESIDISGLTYEKIYSQSQHLWYLYKILYMCRPERKEKNINGVVRYFKIYNNPFHQNSDGHSFFWISDLLSLLDNTPKPPDQHT